MTEREAWLLLATHLEAIGMPRDEWGHCCAGLCECIEMLYGDYMITAETIMSMQDKIDAALGKKRMYLEHRYAAKPRVKWCLKFAEESR